jgi:hypothetical protein
MDTLSAADVMALTNGNGNDNWQNNPFIYLVWLAVLGNGGIFGNRGADAATQGAITRADLNDGFANAEIQSGIRGLQNGLCDGFYANNTTALQGFAGVNAGITELGYNMKDCCCQINRSIDALAAENYKNTCAITTAVHAEGEATRALIQQNMIQELRDRIEAQDRDLLTANFQLSQQAQSANLLNTLRPFPQPAYITCSPYAQVNPCGYCG